MSCGTATELRIDWVGPYRRIPGDGALLVGVERLS